MTYLGLGYLGAGLGAGLCMLGAAFGIARLAAAALEGTARQPEAAGALRTSMIIPAALIEGLGFFALVICLLVALNLGLPKGGAPEAAPTSQAAH
ncbi:MAG: ATP synthase F0 subunit C [Elusimicrobia bacterium RIFCSPLOWO2_01_FULL_54_10]|nr:MAG: ATP synthase F0 subunit C [Elusimicrobia bacterium RIFCSPLOWO2_01_FULL_54_10]